MEQNSKTPNLNNGLPGLAINRPVTMIMIFISLLVVGAIAWTQMPIQLIPSGADPPYLWVWLSYPNASPQENLDRIAIPVEDAFWTIKGVKNITSRSRPNGCGVEIEFNQNVEMDVAYLAIRDRLERVRAELPDDLRYIYINRYSESDEPIIYFGISVHGAYDDPYRLVKEEVVNRIERIDGVANVEIWGGDAKTIQINFRLDRLRAYDIDIGSILQQLRASHFILAGGRIVDGTHDLFVRTDARLSSLEEIEAIPVKGSEVRLGDIAEIKYQSPERISWVQRIGRKPAIQLGAFKESGANTVETCKKILAELESIQMNPELSGLEFDVFFDQGQYIDESLNNLKEAGIWGAFFALIVLLVFLRRWRMTIFITLAIPFSILITVTALYFMGWSLNVITLSGLMICVGLVVDNAIVVVENIQAFKRRGYNSREAAVLGTNEVGLAITLATLTTAVVFLPIVLMSHDRMMTFFMLRIGLPVIFALIASLFISLLFIPLAVQRMALSGDVKSIPIIERGSDKIADLVDWVLNHRLDTFVILFLVMASTAIPLKFMESSDEESSNINDFRLRFNFPPHYSLARADSTLDDYESYLYENAQRFDLKTTVTRFNRMQGRIRVFMNKPPDKNWMVEGVERVLYNSGIKKRKHLTREEVIKEIQDSLLVPPGVEFYTGWNRSSGKENVTYVSIFGEDTDRLMELSADVQKRLFQIEGVLSIEPEMENSNDEIRIIFDRELTTKFGVNPATTAYGMNSLIRGVNLVPVQFNGYEIDAVAQLRESDRETLSQIMNLPAGGISSSEVRLDDVAKVSFNKGVGEISRENSRTRISLKITSTEDNINKLSGKINKAMAGLALPVGYEWAKGARFREVDEATAQRSQAWLLAIMFVFLLMGALFESFLMPIAVIATVPFSFFGVYWLLFLTGTKFGLMAGIGVIILIGVVVNNAIVLVDLANRLRESGMERNLALREAAKLRYRPILMTALTTIMGLFPMAMGSASFIGIPYAPMGRVIMGGLFTATITTPIVVPLAYSLIDDFQIWIKSYISSYKHAK